MFGIVIRRNNHQARTAQGVHLAGNLSQRHIRQVSIQHHQVKRQAGKAGKHFLPGLHQADAIFTGFFEADADQLPKGGMRGGN